MNSRLKKKKSSLVRKRRIIDSFIYLILTVISIIWIFPFIFLLLQAFRGESTGPVNYLIPKEFTLDNFKAILTFTGAEPFMKWYVTTLLISIVTCVLQTILVLMTAYCLSRLRFKFRQGIMKMILVIGMFPGFLTMIAIYFVLKNLGLIGNPIGLILVNVASSAMNYYIVKGFFDTIPRSLDEAAMIDGANKNTIFWKVILPLSKPIVIYTILISFIGPWGDYMMSSYILGNDVSNWTVALGLRWFLTGNAGQNITNYFTRFCSGAVFTSIPIVILFFCLQKYYVEGVTGGSVKG